MTHNHKFAIALAAGVALGGVVVQGLHAQATPPTYVVIDISEVIDAEGFKELLPKTGPETLAPFGGKYIIRNQNITALEGTAPKRFVVIAFDTAEHAKAWKESPATKAAEAIRIKTTKSRSFTVEGVAQP